MLTPSVFKWRETLSSLYVYHLPWTHEENREFPRSITKLWQSLPNIPGTKIAEDFLREIVIPPAAEFGQLLADPIRSFRFANQVRILVKAKEKLKANGISPDKVSLKVLVPLLENGSLEESPDMVERWATLLATAANPSPKHQVTTADVETLRLLSPNAAVILDIIYDHCSNAYRSGKMATDNEFYVSKSQIRDTAGLNLNEFDKAFNIVDRLNLIATNGIPFISITYVSDTLPIALTQYAYEFVSKCRGLA
jgi:hypothetical protein